ncbi:MAG: hypothetical protein WBG62_11995, partial [Cyclobacteriaceae bacterium]
MHEFFKHYFIKGLLVTGLSAVFSCTPPPGTSNDRPSQSQTPQVKADTSVQSYNTEVLPPYRSSK